MSRSMNDDHEVRITVLEHEWKRLIELPDAIHSLDKKIGLLLERKECPAPGMCQVLDTRVNELELKQAELKGGWKAIGVLAAMASTLGGVAGWLLNHFTTSKHP